MWNANTRHSHRLSDPRLWTEPARWNNTANKHCYWLICQQTSALIEIEIEIEIHTFPGLIWSRSVYIEWYYHCDILFYL